MDPSLLNTNCMKDITLIQVGKLNYRVNTKSLNMNSQQKGNSKTITPLKELIEVSIPINSKLIGFVIGKQGSVLKSIRSETRAKIKIEKDKNDDEVELAIISGTQVQVDKAKAKILDIIENSNAPVKANYFLSIPVSSIDIQEKVKKLQNHILHLRLEDIQSEMFQPPPSIHLTLGLLHLKTSEDLDKLKSDLSSIRDKLCETGLNEKGLKLNLSKLKVFGNNTGKSRVVYADIQEFNENKQVTQPRRLKQLTDLLWKELNDLGYKNLDQKAPVFHCTILKSNKNGQMFDGKPILEVYSKFQLGEFWGDKVQIAQIGSLGQNGNYNIVGEIDLLKD